MTELILRARQRALTLAIPAPPIVAVKQNQGRFIAKMAGPESSKPRDRAGRCNGWIG
jgi:hypothetical protein